ncbi:oligopeptide/dipeptide ABC transporter ATP-binding protein [Albidovulum sp.]|uniref:oligopeptide/dipeptide ABC transporter ATP-binding protein n=1 Tax=Albidovulum sp. TaxID=1872424 RepID=UPI003529CE7D
MNTIPDIHAPRRARDARTGEPPSPLNPPPGCALHPRCPLANDRCRRDVSRLSGKAASAVARHAAKDGRA